MKTPLRILVADDDAIVRWLVRGILSRTQYIVDAVPDGEAALAMLRIHKYDILITGHGIEDVSGLYLAETARSLYPGIKCIVIAASFTPDALSDYTAVGASLISPKPRVVHELPTALNRLVGYTDATTVGSC